MSLWVKLAVIFSSPASSAVFGWFQRTLPILLTPSNLVSGVFYFGAGCAFTLISICVALVLLFFSLTAKHTPAPPPPFPVSADGRPRRGLTKVQKKKLSLVQQQQQQLWFAASKPQPAVYVAGCMHGTLWTIPVSAWPRGKLPPEYPPSSEGPAAISHKWDAVLSKGVLALSLVGSEGATRVEIPLPGCSCVIVKESLLKPDGKMMGPWHKRAPLDLSHPSRALLYGESSVFIFAETGAAKEQWYLALTSESEPEGAQARTRASYQAFCSHMVQAAERLALPQPPAAAPAPKPQEPAPAHASGGSDSQQKGGSGKPGRKFGLGWIARLVPGRRGKPAQQQQKQKPSASPSQQDLQQQQQQQQAAAAVAGPESQPRKDGPEGEQPARAGAGDEAPVAGNAPPEGGQTAQDPGSENLDVAGGGEGPLSTGAAAPVPSSFDFHCPSRLREDSSRSSFALSPSFASYSICSDRDARLMQAVAEEEAGGGGGPAAAGDPGEEPSLRHEAPGPGRDAGSDKAGAEASDGAVDALLRTVVASCSGVLSGSPFPGGGPASEQLATAMDSALAGAGGEGAGGASVEKDAPGAAWQGGEGAALQLPVMPLTMDWPPPVSELPLELLEPDPEPEGSLPPPPPLRVLQEQEQGGAAAAERQGMARASAPLRCSSGGLTASSSVPDLRQGAAQLGSSIAGSYEDLNSLVLSRSPASSVSGRSDSAGDPLKHEAKQAAKEEARRRDEARRQQEDARRQQQHAAKRAAREAAERQKQQQRDEASRQKSVRQEEARRKQEEQAKARKEQEPLPYLPFPDGKASGSDLAPEQPGAGPRLPAGLEGGKGEAIKEEGADHRPQRGDAAVAPGQGVGDPSRGQLIAGLLGLNMLLTRMGFEILGAQRLERWLHRLVQRKLDEFKRPAYLHPLQLETLDFGSSFPLLRELRAVAGAGGSACTFPQLLADLAFSGRITLVVSTSVELQQAGLIKKLQAAFGRMAGIQGEQQGPAAEQGGGSARGSADKLSEMPASAPAAPDDAQQQADGGGGGDGGGGILRSRSTGVGAPGSRGLGVPSAAASCSSLRLDEDKRAPKGEDADADAAGRPGGRPGEEPALTRRASDAPPAAGSSNGSGGSGGGGNLFSGLLNLSRAAAAKAGSLAAGFTESLPRVPCQLEICITRFECELMVWASPPPSDRIWLCFAAPPSVDISTRPLFGNRVLRYGAVLSQVSALLKAKILKVLNKTLVFPAAVDIRMGFFANPEATNAPQASPAGSPAPAPQPPEAPPQATAPPSSEPADLPPAAAASLGHGAASGSATLTDPGPCDPKPPPQPEPVLPPPVGLSLNIGLPPRPSRPQPPLSASTSAPELEYSRASAPGTPRSAAASAAASVPAAANAPAPSAPPAPSNPRKGLSLAFRFRGFGRKRENPPAPLPPPAEAKPPPPPGPQPPSGVAMNGAMQGHSAQASSRANSTQPNSRANSTRGNSTRSSLDLNPAMFPGIDEMTSVSPEGSGDERDPM